MNENRSFHLCKEILTPPAAAPLAFPGVEAAKRDHERERTGHRWQAIEPQRQFKQQVKRFIRAAHKERKRQ
jgi:hypothetical protein